MVRAKKQAKVADTVSPPCIGAISNLFRGNPEDVAQLFASYGLESVQIQPNFGRISIQSASDIRPKSCREMSRPFQEAGVRVAGVSAYTNFLDPETQRRKLLIKRFDAILEHCKDFGTTHVVTETGTLNADRPWEDFADNRRPEALAAFKRNLAPSAKLAEKLGVTILLKGYLYHVVHSMDLARNVHEHFGPHVQFVMDPANYFTRNMASASTSFIRKIFEVMGEFCPIAHGKDVRYVGGSLTTPRAGTGNMDYREYLELLHEYQPECPLILEQIRPEELRETLDFLDRFFS